MSHALLIVLIVCAAIFLGSIEQARIVLRRKPSHASGALEARRNTLRGELSALILGINQVQRYIDLRKKDQAQAALEAVAQAKTALDQARALKQEVADTLDKAASDNAIQICALKLDQARFHVHQARIVINKGTDSNDQDQDADK